MQIMMINWIKNKIEVHNPVDLQQHFKEADKDGDG
jgi:hypothetical protein